VSTYLDILLSIVLMKVTFVLVNCIDCCTVLYGIMLCFIVRVVLSIFVSLVYGNA